MKNRDRRWAKKKALIEKREELANKIFAAFAVNEMALYDKLSKKYQKLDAQIRRMK